MKIKIIVKRNNENASLKIQNHLITIDYVLPKAITWLRRRKRIQSIVFVHVLNRKIIIVKTKFNNSMLLYCNSRGQYIFRLPVSPSTTEFVIIF